MYSDTDTDEDETFTVTGSDEDEDDPRDFEGMDGMYSSDDDDEGPLPEHAAEASDLEADELAAMQEELDEASSDEDAEQQGQEWVVDLDEESTDDEGGTQPHKKHTKRQQEMEDFDEEDEDSFLIMMM